MEQSAGPKPLELILARNLLSSLSTPGFLIDAPGEIIFFNDAAGVLLGQRFEETGPMGPEQWTRTFGPFGDDGESVPFDKLELTQALRGDNPAHARFCIRSANGQMHRIEASGFPIVGAGGFFGALVFFWETSQ